MRELTEREISTLDQVISQVSDGLDAGRFTKMIVRNAAKAGFIAGLECGEAQTAPTVIGQAALVEALRMAADDLQMASALLDNHGLHETADRLFAKSEAIRAALASVEEVE